MPKDTKSCPKSFLENIKTLPSLIDKFDVLAILSSNKNDYDIVKKNKSEFINFLKILINKIEPVSGFNAENSFISDSERLITIKNSLSDFSLKNSEFFNAAVSELNSIINFLSLIDKNQINFSHENLQDIRQEIVIIKCEFFC